MDGDGIPYDSDACPNGYGEDEGWNPNQATDRDGDGCHDFEEDIDDDNDLIPDIDDQCASEIGWVSTELNEKIGLELESIVLEKCVTFHGYPKHVFAHLQ